ncbi:glycosyltransferase family 2 protein [Mesoterricola silvestris]|uniref:Glycosyl transferase n=1 Tax=Mesoterricola silvestris TaxID=2927979 RepID=A0AA48K6Q8_9BACT|nr:glycosyltransferase family 2 protein [Mesoterricola silvestris]BDU71074.1 glycosyl transferase [Mesoterricola silvestris]
MKISVITVVWNNPQVAEALKSILEQKTSHEVELVVIDGGSAEPTLEAIRPFLPRIAYFVSEPDKGLYDAMNKGIAAATGDILGTLNSDDVLDNDGVLQRIAETFEAGTCDAVFGDLAYVASDDINRIIRYWKSSPYKLGSFESGWLPPFPTFYARREVYVRLGGFNTEYRIAADMELMLRFIAINGIRTTHIPGILVRMRMGGASNRNLGNILRMNGENWRAFRDHGIHVSPLYFLRKFTSRLFQFVKRPR